MNITTFLTTDNPNKLNKTLTQLQTFTVSLIHSQNILTPELIFTKSNYNMQANYLYIQEYNAYYFITDRNIDSGNRITLECSIDCLYTNREQILNCDVTVIRNENVKTNYFQDDKLPLLPGEFSIEGINMSAVDGFPNGGSGGYIVGVL